MMKEQKAVYTENACKAAYDKLILGQDSRCCVSMDCSEMELNNNIMVVGGTGSGKTMGTVMPNILNVKHTNIIALFNTEMPKKWCSSGLQTRSGSLMI